MRSSLLPVTAMLALAALPSATSVAQVSLAGYWEGYPRPATQTPGAFYDPYASYTPPAGVYAPYPPGPRQPYNYPAPQAGYAPAYNPAPAPAYPVPRTSYDPYAPPADQYASYPTYQFQPYGRPAPPAGSGPGYAEPRPPYEAYAVETDRPASHPGAPPPTSPRGMHLTSANGGPAEAAPVGGPDMMKDLGDAEACVDPCATPCVQWMITAELMYLVRSSASSYPLIAAATPDTSPPPYSTRAVFLDASDIDYSGQFGYRVGLTRMLVDSWGLELGFLGIGDSWKYDRTFTGIIEVTGPGYTIGADPNLGLPVALQVHENSHLYSTELNVTRGICDWATLRGGVRWIRLDESLSVNELYTPIMPALSASAKNQMIGPQAGVDLKLLELWTRLRLGATLNFGMLYNSAEFDTCSAIVGPPLHSEADELVLMSELGVNAKFRVTDHVALRGGFYMLGLQGVALATDQLASSDVVTEMSALHTGSVIAYGGSFGVEVFW